MEPTQQALAEFGTLRLYKNCVVQTSPGFVRSMMLSDVQFCTMDRKGKAGVKLMIHGSYHKILEIGGTEENAKAFIEVLSRIHEDSCPPLMITKEGVSPIRTLGGLEKTLPILGPTWYDDSKSPKMPSFEECVIPADERH